MEQQGGVTTAWERSECHPCSLPSIARLRSTTSCLRGVVLRGMELGAVAERSPLHKHTASGLMHVLARSITGSLFMSTMFKRHAGCLEH